MPRVQTHLISSYTIDIASYNEGGVNKSWPMIYLFNADGRQVAYVWFNKDGESFPGNWFTGNGILLITYPESWFNQIVHLLQSEKPIYARIGIADGYYIGTASIGTSELEPVGQEEFGEPQQPAIPVNPI